MGKLKISRDVVGTSIFSRVDSRYLLLGLYFGCPLETPKIDCPMVNNRKLAPAMMMNIIQKMKEDEINTLINTHRKCLFERTID